MKYINVLLLFIPFTIIGEIANWNEGLIFFAACLSIVPLAVLIGNSTEQLSVKTGPKIGGLLNATMGNIPELLIGIFAVKAGMYNLVLASMAGSIIGNILLVLGFSIFLGGLRYKFQTFNKNIARSNLSLLTFAAISIVIPFAFKYASRIDTSPVNGMVVISFGIALILLIVYILGLVFSLVTHKNIFFCHEENERVSKITTHIKPVNCIITLTLATFFIAVESEILVSNVEHMVNQFGLSEMFIGIILIPILGNVAEHASAVIMAVKNKIDISIEIAVGSSMQIALFVAPILILISFALGNPLKYIYSPFEIVGMLTAAAMSVFVFQDGKTNWLEGVLLISCYAILSLAFYFT